MHRSGTSALSGALAAAGLNPGKELFEPEEDNPKGNFENARITMMNENILQELYAKWNDTLFIQDGWHRHELFKPVASEARRIIAEEFEEGGNILIKDPRMSVLLPFYLDILESLNVKPVFIICVRNPYEIAASLDKRNHLAREKSLLLWLDYQLKAELYSRNHPRIIVSYRELLREPNRVMESIIHSLNPGIPAGPETATLFKSFLDPGLRHHEEQAELPGSDILPWLSEVYQAFLTTSGNDLPESCLRRFDEIRNDFYTHYRFYNGMGLNYDALIRIHTENGRPIIRKFPASYGKCRFALAPDPGNRVTQIIFKPSNARVGILITKFEFHHENGTVSLTDQITSNAEFITESGHYIFETEMPEISCRFQEPVAITEVEIQLEYLALGRSSYRMGTRFKRDALSRLEHLLEKEILESTTLRTNLSETETRLHHCEARAARLTEEISSLKNANRLLVEEKATLNWQINSMLNSLSWKTGKILTAPLRVIMKATGR
jgi:hypothetical protein